MAGKRGLVMGVANDHSIAWGIAKALREQGAELAFTYQGEAFGKRVRPLAGSLGSNLVLPCDVEDDNDIERVFTEIDKAWGSMDFLVHAIAYSDKEELKGRYLDTTRRNFARTLAISCYSFTALAKQAQPLMRNGGSLVTLSYLGAERVTPNYNVMGVAKAALEASVRYLSADLGPQGVRVNAISHRRRALRLPLEPAARAAQAQCPARGGRRRRAVPSFRSLVGRDRRGALRGRRLQPGRHSVTGAVGRRRDLTPTVQRAPQEPPRSCPARR
jgi:enoyl-[acyl-carrier protein] reductase I